MNEAEFSRSLVKHWRGLGYFVQRVETGQISRGVPDLYVANRAGSTWVELKSVKWNPYDGMQVPWRPGQQGWMLDHYLSTGRPCFTVIKCPNLILALPMIKRFKNNTVSLADVQVYRKLSDLTL